MLTEVVQALVSDPTVEWTFLKGDSALRKVRAWPCVRKCQSWLGSGLDTSLSSVSALTSAILRL